MRNRWVKINNENVIVEVAYLNDPTPDLLNRVNPGNWIRVGDADVPNPQYDLADVGNIYDAETDSCIEPPLA